MIKHFGVWRERFSENILADTIFNLHGMVTGIVHIHLECSLRILQDPGYHSGIGIQHRASRFVSDIQCCRAAADDEAVRCSVVTQNYSKLRREAFGY